MTRGPRFSGSSSCTKTRANGRRRSQVPDSISQNVRVPHFMRAISVAQACTFTLRNKRLLKIYCHLACHDDRTKRALLSSTPVKRAQVTLQRMSGLDRSRSGSQSPRPRCQSTTSTNSTGGADALPAGRERLAIRFLAGQQPRPRTVSTSGGGSAGAPDYVRHRVLSTHVPGSSSGRHRGFVATPSNLGGGSSPTYAIPASPPGARGRIYQLDVEQHPVRSAEFGPALLSRLPLAPPPIVKLTIRDQAGSPINPNTELPFLVAHLSLCTEDGSPLDGEDAPGAPPIPQRLLYGTLVSSAQVLRNLRGHVSPYFIFPDVSIRQRGRYRLKITLMRLPRIGETSPGSSSDQGSNLATAWTDVFDVVSHTNYVAPQLTQLTQLFIRQGARMTYGM